MKYVDEHFSYYNGTHFWHIFKSQVQQNSRNALEKLAFHYAFLDQIF